ncbi:MAG: DegT/DnrJ/EryC1/StrS family aminotransferase [Euryarchaeota archaeon]|nr:DegT/DnrJ/EryC1/StrS family aminotransferase [Euryarchaeota archaeon]
MIALADPRAENLLIQDEIEAACRRVIEGGRYILGPEVEAFEAEFASYLGTKHGIGVGNGTDAIEVALRALGIGPGDEVITVSHTAVATATAIRRTGASPVFVDIDPQTYTMDPDAAAAAVTARTKALLPVHLYGQAADLAPLLETAEAHGLPLVEDCAQAHGAHYDGRRVGSFGALSCFSFYPTKNLGAIGDGGLVATADPELAERCRLLREYGWKERYVSSSDGWNSRLDEMQAAILRVKLPHLDSRILKRRELASHYLDRLVDTGVETPTTGPDRDHVYHLFVVQPPERDRVMEELQKAGVGCGIHYPVPIHLQPAFAGRSPVRLPETEQAAKDILTLPMHPVLGTDEIIQTCDLLGSVLSNRTPPVA